MKITKQLIIGISLFLSAEVFAGIGAGNGTDQVATLFAQAKEKNIETLNSFDANDLVLLNIDNEFKEWLKKEEEEQTRLLKLKIYANRMIFDFETPCEDGSDICYDNSDPRKPIVRIDKRRNENTTLSQAQAKLYHEAGHFTEENDHLFLDEFGAQMVSQGPLDPIDKVNRWKEIPTEHEGYRFLALTAKENSDNKDNEINYIVRQRADSVCQLYGYPSAGSYIKFFPAPSKGEEQNSAWLWIVETEQKHKKIRQQKFDSHIKFVAEAAWPRRYTVYYYACFSKLKCVLE
ncbi:MAG: hypothetical protein HYY62_05395 [Deltaproteobacteria bacterium]|nr:hypothetical protein [Deltaproteobacteria bacterium]